MYEIGDKNMTNQEMILVLDFGSQYNQLITRRVRELGVYSELHSYKITADKVKELNPTGIILSGGPHSVLDEDRYEMDETIFDLNIPILGICYGMHLIADKFGGQVSESNTREYGHVSIEVMEENPLFKNTKSTQDVWKSQGDQVTTLPEGFTQTAKTSTNQIVAFRSDEKKMYGLQFHPEVGNTEYGTEILKNFIYGVCKADGDWSIENFIDQEIGKIKAQVGDRNVLCALSGGVDSSVVATLIHRAIGDQLTCIFVDHGLLRKNEGNDVMELLGGEFNMNIIKVDAKDRFLSKLKGVDDPEEKRKIIGNEFIYVFDDEAEKLDDIQFLAQGTLYSDVIESGTDTAETIKSHHNVGGLPEDMEFELIEPLNKLFKDEVRALGTELGIPDSIVWRQPFPGPGLAIRILGEVTKEKIEIVRESDAILREEIAAAGLERDIWQYFAVLPNIRSVGVRDGARTYDHTVGIRAVTSVDGTTSDWARIPWEVLDKISRRIMEEVEGTNRVVYDVTSKPPSTIEWE